MLVAFEANKGVKHACYEIFSDGLAADNALDFVSIHLWERQYPYSYYMLQRICNGADFSTDPNLDRVRKRKSIMNRKWILETTEFDELHFVWNRGNDNLTLHDRQLDEAMQIAKEFGYRPFSWFRPSTWGNECVAYDDQVSDAGAPGTFRYSVPAAQQKRILNSGK